MDASGKTWEEVLSKQGGKLAFNLFQRFRALSPKKGQIRSERLAALRRGEGILVRRSARDFARRNTVATASSLRTRSGIRFRQLTKSGRSGRNWWQVAVAREIAIREGGRGFLSISARYPRLLSRQATAVSKFGPVLSRMGIIVAGARARAQFVWDPGEGPLAASAAQALDRPRGRAAVQLALRDLDEDIEVYLVRKTQERIDKAGLK